MVGDPDWYDSYEMTLAVYNHQYADRTEGLRERLRWIWHILKTGKPYTDMVLLNPVDARKVANKLNECADFLDDRIKAKDNE